MQVSDRADVYGEKQFNITYDNVKKAYRIKNLYTNDYLTWTSNQNNDVIHFGNGDYADQLWYLKKQSSANIYSLVNAHNTYRFLNLHSGEINISILNNLKVVILCLNNMTLKIKFWINQKKNQPLVVC
ncbi:MAG: RICIN domain-containing protein [Oscillospiraceae bacterium]|nr:RICIN domain-containing protein [Oscillospiraceae bacterium]